MKHRTPHTSFLAVALSALLLTAGAFVPASAAQAQAETPLHKAAVRGDAEEVVRLIKAGEDLEAKNKDNMTPLHGAAAFGGVEVVTVLLEAGAYLEAKNKDCATPHMGLRPLVEQKWSKC